MANIAGLKHAIEDCDDARISFWLAHCFRRPAEQDELLCPQSREIASVMSPLAHRFNTTESMDSTFGSRPGLCSSPCSWDGW